MYEFLSLSRDKFKNTLLAPLREVHAFLNLYVVMPSVENLLKNATSNITQNKCVPDSCG